MENNDFGNQDKALLFIQIKEGCIHSITTNSVLPINMECVVIDHDIEGNNHVDLQTLNWKNEPKSKAFISLRQIEADDQIDWVRINLKELTYY